MSIRAFFAVDLADKELVKKVVKIQKELDFPETKINFVPSENFHLTLKFLGNLDEQLIPELKKEAEKIHFTKFQLEFSGMGCLPNFNYINAIYIDISKGFTELSSLAKKIEDMSGSFNFKKEDRPFRAHLTIGRVKRVQNKDPLVNKIKENASTIFGKVNIDSFKLKKSDLSSDHPVYNDLFEIKSSI